MNEKQILNLVNLIAMNFRSFGGGQMSSWNPLVNALKNKPPQFAAGVDIREVVEFIITQADIKSK